MIIRRVGRAWRVLTLKRAEGVRSTGAWEIVHGNIEAGETPIEAARREVREETGLAIDRLYTITANPFYLARTDTLQISLAFAAVVMSAKFTLAEEHSAGRWETLAAAQKRLAWPRTHDLLRHVAWILRSGDAGPLEGVLRAK